MRRFGLRVEVAAGPVQESRAETTLLTVRVFAPAATAATTREIADGQALRGAGKLKRQIDGVQVLGQGTDGYEIDARLGDLADIVQIDSA